MTNDTALADRLVAQGIGSTDGEFYSLFGDGKRYEKAPPHYDHTSMRAEAFVRDGRVVLAVMQAMNGDQLNRFAQQMVVTTGRGSLYPNQWTLSRQIQDPVAIITAGLNALETTNWDRLQAAQESLREHMQIIKDKTAELEATQAEIERLTSVNADYLESLDEAKYDEPELRAKLDKQRAEIAELKEEVYRRDCDIEGLQADNERLREAGQLLKEAYAETVPAVQYRALIADLNKRHEYTGSLACEQRIKQLEAENERLREFAEFMRLRGPTPEIMARAIAALTDQTDAGEGGPYPETKHKRDCAYITTDGPAPCTCSAADTQEIDDG